MGTSREDSSPHFLQSVSAADGTDEDEIMIELTEREENGMRKRGGKRKGKEEKKPRSLRKEEGRRKED